MCLFIGGRSEDVCSGRMGLFPYTFCNVFYAKINEWISNTNVFYVEIREKKVNTKRLSS